jgi:hypothetical protein
VTDAGVSEPLDPAAQEDLVRQARQLRRRIDRLVAALDAAYAERRELMIAMDPVLSRRAAGAVWGVSGVVVTNAINGDRYSRGGAPD